MQLVYGWNMERIRGSPSRAGVMVPCALVVAGSVLAFEGYVGRIGGTLTLVAFFAGLLVAVGCGYVGGGYPASLVCGYLPFVGSGLAHAVASPAYDFTSAQIYHVLWSLAVPGVVVGTLGFLVGAVAANRITLEENRTQILLVCLVGIVFSGILWLTCSPFHAGPCGGIGTAL